MKLDIISYTDLLHPENVETQAFIKQALFKKGIIGVRDIPEFEIKSNLFINTARQFGLLDESIKQKYAPNRDKGDTEGYELGAEWFKNKTGDWQIDDKKASYYAIVPDHHKNKWPTEIDLKTPYLALAELMFNTGKILLDNIGINNNMGLNHNNLVGYGRMLHYIKESDQTNENPDWNGAHLDHGVFTALLPAYYFQQDQEVNEPSEAGLYIVPSNGSEFEKIDCPAKNILLFQVGEFAQLLSNDAIKATQHMVKKAHNGIERFTLAVFFNAYCTSVKSSSVLIQDDRYRLNQSTDGSISYETWEKVSFERYRVKKIKPAS